MQIGEAAKNGVTTAIIADSLQQAEADGPDEADAQCIIEHGAVMLAEGNAGIDGTCLRKAGQNIAHDELYLEKNGIGSQKLAAEGRALMHKAVDHDNHAEHTHGEMRAALQHLAAGGTGKDFSQRHCCQRQGLVLGIKVEDGQKACNIGDAGGGSNTGYLIMQDNDEEYIQQQVDNVAGKCGEYRDTYMQCTGEPSLCCLEDERQRHNPDEQTVVTLQQGGGCCVGIEEQQSRPPDRLLQNDEEQADAEGCQHSADKSTGKQLGIVLT